MDKVMVTQEDREAAATFIGDGMFGVARASIDLSDGSLLVQAFTRHRIDSIARLSPAPEGVDATGYAQGIEDAAAYHDRKAAKWRKEALKHHRSDGRRSDYEQRDLERARRHEQDAKGIRALSRPPAAEQVRMRGFNT